MQPVTFDTTNTSIMSNERKKLSNSFWVGAIILAIGSILLLDRMDLFFMPWWLFSWKTFLIALGVIIGINKRFEGIGWLVLILVGSFFLIDDIPGFPFDIDQYAFPVGVIIIGLFILARAVMGTPAREARKKNWGDGVISNDDGGEDYFDLTTVFGGNKRKVYSKNFKGGESTCIFGGTEIDLSQADINGTVVIDVVQLFGGVKLIIPSNWELKSEITAILGGVDDKRSTPQAYGSGKRLVLTGFVMFGGVDIKSYN
jgi:predicted membrane protein